MDNKRRDYLLSIVPIKYPDGFEKWVKDECLKDCNYIFYDKPRQYAFCSHCESQIDKRLLVSHFAKHKEKSECPVCNMPITYLCIGRFQNSCIRNNIIQVKCMQPTTEGIIIRLFEVARNCSYDSLLKIMKVKTTFDELQRVFNNGKQIDKIASYYGYFHCGKISWAQSNSSSFGSKGGSFGGMIIETFDFTKNIKETLDESPLKYAKRNQDFYYYSGWLNQCEYLEKMGMTNFAKDIIRGRRFKLNFKASTMEKFLRVSNNYIKIIKDNNLDIQEVDTLKWMIKNEIPKIDAKMIKEISHHIIMLKKIRKISPQANINKIIRFEKRNRRYLSLYSDYISFCKKLNYDLNDEDVLLPDDLNEAHDREMERVVIASNEINDAEVLKRFNNDMKKHGFATNEMFIIPPKSAKEIIKEGSALKHCVGSYIERVVEGKTTILFVRLQSDPNKPFYTVEWKCNRMVQIRGHKNDPPTPEAAEFIKKWESRNKKKTKQKIKVAI